MGTPAGGRRAGLLTVEFDAVGAPDELQFGACAHVARAAEAQGLVELKIGQRQWKVLGLGRLQGQLHKASRRKHHLTADAVIAQIGRTARRESRAVAPLEAAWQRQGL